MKYSLLLLIGLILVAVPSVALAQQYGGGSGTEADPYQIWTPEQMNRIGGNIQDRDKHFILMQHIDLSSITDFNRIGTSNVTAFTGVFDGNGLTISNFTFDSDSTDYVGLFGYVQDGGKIENLTLTNVNVRGHSYVGGLVGYIQSSIYNCSVSGVVNGGTSVGGLAGYYKGPFTSVIKCSSSANITAGYFVGGLIGRTDTAGIISKCFSTGEVYGAGYYSYSGGLIGFCDGNATVSECYAIGNVSGSSGIGGFAGYNLNSSISNCYANGQVYGYSTIGGFVGDEKGTISNCYSTGFVSSGTSFVGGFVGFCYSDVDNCFWDIQTSEQVSSSCGWGLSTTEMQQEITYTNVGWDFTTPIWKICEGTNYPKLAWQVPLQGDFVCPDGVEINDLAVLVNQWLLGKLSADIAPAPNGDGIVNLIDFTLLAENWMK